MAVPAESSAQEPKTGTPPEVPPRTKKRSTKTCVEVQQPPRPNPEREVLVATSRGSRERKPESRQRQPPAILAREPSELGEVHPEELIPIQKEKPRRGPHLLVLPPNKGPRMFSPMHLHQPIRLIPVQPVSVTYGNWIRKVGAGDPDVHANIFRRILTNHVVLRPVKVQAGRAGGYPVKFALANGAPTGIAAKNVTRSGSLSSQGSNGSDSGNDSRPKSALRKVRRGSLEPKKVVTFNAMTTVQVMEE